jgi:hypothetical protein
MSSISLDHLFSLTNEYRSIKYDLRNMQLLMDHLDNPQRTFRSILIAGTNGKGSVASLLSAMIPGAGLYTSPHLVKLNERIRIGNQEISDADLQSVYEQVFVLQVRQEPRLSSNIFRVGDGHGVPVFQRAHQFCNSGSRTWRPARRDKCRRQDASVITALVSITRSFSEIPWIRLPPRRPALLRSRAGCHRTGSGTGSHLPAGR